MNELVFRAKPAIDNEYLEGMEMTLEEYVSEITEYKDGFVYGQVVYSSKFAWIVGEIVDWDPDYLAHEWWIPVDLETIGRCTGLHDVNGVLIFEGDILYDAHWDSYGVVVYDEGGFRLEIDNLSVDLRECTGYEIRGNKWADPKLARWANAR